MMIVIGIISACEAIMILQRLIALWNAHLLAPFISLLRWCGLAASAFLATGMHRGRNLSWLPSKAGQLTFLRDAFVRFLRAFDVIFEFSAGVRQQLGDFVWPRGCMGEGHARERELYDLPYFELVHSDYRFSLPLDFESPRRTVLTSCPFSPAGATWRPHQSLKPPSFR